MILFFGPTGSGKSLQGQILAARQGWRWLSAGQMLRDAHDPTLLKSMQDGKLIDSESVEKIIGEALANSSEISKVILDGFPRKLDQAKWLIENQSSHNRSIGLAIVLDISEGEIEKRLNLRGRVDDNAKTLSEKMETYYREIDPLLNYFNEHNIKVSHINGSGSVGQVHDRIMEELSKCKLV
jgi:adenylate kinase